MSVNQPAGGEILNGRRLDDRRASVTKTLEGFKRNAEWNTPRDLFFVRPEIN